MNNINYKNFNNKYLNYESKNNIMSALKKIYDYHLDKSISYNNKNIINFTNEVNKIIKKKKYKIPFYTLNFSNKENMIFNNINKLEENNINDMLYPQINNIDDIKNIYYKLDIIKKLFYNDYLFNFDKYIIKNLKKK